MTQVKLPHTSKQKKA